MPGTQIGVTQWKDLEPLNSIKRGFKSSRVLRKNISWPEKFRPCRNFSRAFRRHAAFKQV